MAFAAWGSCGPTRCPETSNDLLPLSVNTDRLSRWTTNGNPGRPQNQNFAASYPAQHEDVDTLVADVDPCALSLTIR